MPEHSQSWRQIRIVFGQVATLLSSGSRPSASASASADKSIPDPFAQSEARPERAVEGLDVCLLSYRSDPHSGGQGVYVKYLSRALERRGHDVTVVSGKPYPDLDSAVDLVELPGENVVDETDRLRAFEPGYLGEPTKLFEWASVLTGGFPDPYTFGRRAATYLAEHGHRFDVVHDNQSLAYGLLDLDLPVVATIHHPITADREIDLRTADGLTERLLTRRWYRFLGMQRRVASALSHLIVPSVATKRRTVADFDADPGAISVVHNGVDAEQFRPIDRDANPKRIVTTVSADVPLKGARHLLEAVAALRDDHPAAELVVVGEFDEDGTAASLSRDLGIDDAVETHADISTEALVRLYGTAGVAVVPSLFEGFGLPAAEAMACGVPVVATTGGALPEVVGDAGRLVPPADGPALAAAIGDLFEDPAARERLGRHGRERVTSAFDWDVAATRTAAVYREAIDAHR
jgi:glycosyltransferase involved in cell wall biosynthesis